MTSRAQSRGFTFIELLIAAMILTVGLVGSVAMITALARTNSTTRGRDVAYFLVQQAMDELSMTPFQVQNSNFGLAVTNNISNSPPPGTPTCYLMSDDQLLDHPVSCTPTGAAPAMYIVRTWTCCAAAQMQNNPVAVGSGVCNAPVTLTTADKAGQGAVCWIQAEVSWPQESPATNTTLAGSATQLFADSIPSLGLAFSNHVYASMVREN